jgi:hypothetical protein
MYENGNMRPVKLFQEQGERKQRKMMEGMNLTMTYCKKNFCKCNNIYPVQQYSIKIFKKRKTIAFQQTFCALSIFNIGLWKIFARAGFELRSSCFFLLSREKCRYTSQANSPNFNILLLFFYHICIHS